MVKKSEIIFDWRWFQQYIFSFTETKKNDLLNNMTSKPFKLYVKIPNKFMYFIDAFLSI